MLTTALPSPCPHGRGRREEDRGLHATIPQKEETVSIDGTSFGEVGQPIGPRNATALATWRTVAQWNGSSRSLGSLKMDIDARQTFINGGQMLAALDEDTEADAYRILHLHTIMRG